jgi:hypothetical protein
LNTMAHAVDPESAFGARDRVMEIFGASAR